MAEHIFKNKFEVSKLDPDGDEVNRIEAHSVNEMYMQLDVATEVYEPIPFLLGAQHDGIPFMLLGRKTLVDDYEYIMLGKLFKVSKDSTKDDLHGDEILPQFVAMCPCVKKDGNRC
ncbi:DNA-directed RNA polymerases II, IV and V subunit 8B [Zea mays]|uniref:DNA-directed RNA polymerases II, IV and V subunit 8B n=1 Tax=Zea mays TaxID=4577 RepID=A0A3L6ER65_MAIZE|nr:DNA-directed RNA polymerases II, IV and V subunit 8B [Zea mays]